MIMFILETWAWASTPFMLASMYVFYIGIYRCKVLSTYTDKEVETVREVLAEIEDNVQLVPEGIATAVVWLSILFMGSFYGMLWVFDPIASLREIKAVFKQEFKEL